MEDFEIVDLYWQRNERALAETKNKYNNYCFVIANNILKNNADVEEVLSDTYLKVWNSIPDNRPYNLMVYIAKICRNSALTMYQMINRKKRRNVNTDLIYDELEDCIPSTTNIEKELIDKEISIIINNYLSSLEVEIRQIFVRRYFYCDSIKELCKKFGFSESKIKSILFRCRNDLKKILEREGLMT